MHESLSWIDPFGLAEIARKGPVIARAFPGPEVGGIEHAPLHAHLVQGKSSTRVLMEDLVEDGKIVAKKGAVYPGDPAMTKEMKKLVGEELDELAEKTQAVFSTGSCK